MQYLLARLICKLLCVSHDAQCLKLHLNSDKQNVKHAGLSCLLPKIYPAEDPPNTQMCHLL
jgi:hypothetical protein